MPKNIERTHYTVAYENGQLVRRGKKRMGGHEVTTYNNYTRLPPDAWAGAEDRLLAEVALATGSDSRSVQKKLMANYNAACSLMVENAKIGIFVPVPVEVIFYTVDPRRKPINVQAMPIVSSMS